MNFIVFVFSEYSRILALTMGIIDDNIYIVVIVLCFWFVILEGNNDSDNENI